ncbi:MAG: AAA family ATPase [Rhodocyclaceae bacterium]|nr:AAA family ATPase [Rhodocyclaceae bacterium]
MTVYLEHFGLREAPFRLTPHPEFFFAGGHRGETLEALVYALTHEEGILEISGEVGSGKTMLCRMLMDRLAPACTLAYLAHPALSREEMLWALAHELGIESPSDARPLAILRQIQDKLIELHAQGQRVVVLIDEAHAMPRETLEEIRLLSNLETSRHKLLQLVLFGQPELDALLDRDDMRQLRDRITHRFRLTPLAEEEVADYLEFRLRRAGYHGPNPFSPGALKKIAAASQGLTRRINVLADKALLAAYAQGRHAVGNEDVEAAIRDAEFLPIGGKPPAPLRRRILYALLLLIVGALIMGLVAFRDPPWIEPDFRKQASPRESVSLQAPPPSSVPPPAATTAEPARVIPSRPKTVSPLEKSPPSLGEKIVRTHHWAASLPTHRWFIQLHRAEGASAREHIARLLTLAREAGLPEESLGVYRAVRGKTIRYGLIVGEFETYAEASAALAALPDTLKRLHPYPRAASALKPGQEGWRLLEES